MAGVPYQMPDAVAQMIEQSRGPAEQQHDPEPGAEKIREPAIRLGTAGGGDQPPHQQHPAGAQCDAGGTVQDRHDRSELPAINLQVR